MVVAVVVEYWWGWWHSGGGHCGSGNGGDNFCYGGSSNKGNRVLLSLGQRQF